MANGCLYQKVTREEYLKKSTDDKLVCLFDVVSVVQSEMEKNKKRPIADKAWSGAGGFFGGAAAYLASKLFGG